MRGDPTTVTAIEVVGWSGAHRDHCLTLLQTRVDWTDMHPTTDPHGTMPVLRRGPDARQATLAMILLHGRGASAEDIMTIADALQLDDVLYVAPQAADNSWYPLSFLSPIDRNEPGLTSALKRISSLIDELRQQEIPLERIGLLGFSQGACLSLEYAARHARRYAAVVGFSGGVIGPPGTPRNYSGSFDGTPVFLGCSDIDPHVPLERVNETAAVFRALGANVDERIYSGMGHLVNEDELRAARALLMR